VQADDCLLCRKHRGQAPPPGGYIYEDEYWMVCHAPADRGPLGTLFIESRRHLLDFGELTDEEAAAFGSVANKTYRALHALVHPDRIYEVAMMEGVPHFHAWLVPRGGGVTERGVAFLAKDISCAEDEAAQLAGKMRELMR
jgi:diadenosine tetraphosphate (Ap4A) HIT family hydrolase